MANDFYQILGLDRKADDKAIKSSYRKLARKYHPDVNPGDKAAEAKFKEISNAYEVLSDPDKRKAYDKYGDRWEQASQMQDHGESVDFGGGFGSIFDHLFGGGGGFSGGGSAYEQDRPEPARPKDLTIDVELSLEEIDSGTTRTLSYQVGDACKSCDGTGAVRLRAPRQCGTCGGSGVMKGIFGMQQQCASCNGAGRISFEKCPTCAGTAAVRTQKRVEVKIPAGIAEGRKLRVPGRGSVGANGRAGDLYVQVREAKHGSLKRLGDDLETEVHVNYTTAILGGEIRVNALRGPVTMKIPECSQPGQKFRLTNQGMTKFGTTNRGNLIVVLKVDLPKTLSDREREMLKSLSEVKA
jgi:molecular chaperone DnaJ